MRHVKQCEATSAAKQLGRDRLFATLNRARILSYLQENYARCDPHRRVFEWQKCSFRTRGRTRTLSVSSGMPWSRAIAKPGSTGKIFPSRPSGHKGAVYIVAWSPDVSRWRLLAWTAPFRFTHWRSTICLRSLGLGSPATRAVLPPKNAFAISSRIPVRLRHRRRNHTGVRNRK